MSIASLGKFSIDVTPLADNAQIYNVDIGSESRKDTISMRTNVGETPDQFGMRIKSMLRALLNSEMKEKTVEEPPKKGKQDVRTNEKHVGPQKDVTV